MVPVLSLPSVSLQNPLPHIPLQMGLTVLLAGEKQSKSLIPTTGSNISFSLYAAPKMRPYSYKWSSCPHPNLRNFLLSLSFFLPHAFKLVNTPPGKMWGWGVQTQTVPTVPGLIYMLELNPLLSGRLHYDWDSFNTCSVNTFQVFIVRPQ